jgi:hypothetical protein
MHRDVDPELELLRCAIELPSAALARWERLSQHGSPASWSGRQRRLLPAVAKNLRGTSPAGGELLAQAYQTTLAHNRKLREGCAEVVRLFETAGVDVMVFKGLLLSQAVHRDLGVRPAHDFDLLVPLPQARRACALLRDSGWEPADESIDPMERLENAADFRRDGLKLDLHWSLLREARQDWADHELWQERGRFDFETFQADAMSPTHQLFHLLAVANREPHHLRRYLYDLWVLFHRSGQTFDLGQAHGMLRQRGLLHRAQSVPWQTIQAEALRPAQRPPLWDRLWSIVSGHRHDLRGDWNYLLFPFLDYALHFRAGQPPGWSFWAYMARRLRSPHSLPVRVRNKLARLASLWSP